MAILRKYIKRYGVCKMQCIKFMYVENLVCRTLQIILPLMAMKCFSIQNRGPLWCWWICTNELIKLYIFMKKPAQPEWFEVRLVDVIHDY